MGLDRGVLNRVQCVIPTSCVNILAAGFRIMLAPVYLSVMSSLFQCRHSSATYNMEYDSRDSESTDNHI